MKPRNLQEPSAGQEFLKANQFELLQPNEADYVCGLVVGETEFRAIFHGRQARSLLGVG